jgi:virginiamycin B lyase
MTGYSDGAGKRRSTRLRAGMLAATAATALLAAVCGGSPAGASSARGHAARAGGASAHRHAEPAGGYLYWSNTPRRARKYRGTIGRAKLNGTDINKKFITGASLPTAVLVFGRYLYWANIASLRNGAGTIGRAKLNGTDVNEKFITGASEPAGLTAAHSYIYWTNHNGWIGRARLNGTDADQKFIKTAQPNGPDDVVAGSGHLYWANDYNIGRARLNGTDVKQNFIAVPNGPSGVSGLAVNSRYIYWTDETAGRIGRARLNGTHVNQKFITGAAFPEVGLAVDTRYIYWTNNKTGTIGRARLNGTDVNQRFIVVPNAYILIGVAVDPCR